MTLSRRPGLGGWPVLVVLLAVLLPTVCVLWLVNNAIRNQRAVARQNLDDVYHDHLAMAQERLQQDLSRRAAEGARLVASGQVDALLVLGPRGRPQARALPAPEGEKAQTVEESLCLARAARDPAARALAFQAAVRGLGQAGRPEAAAQVVLEGFAGEDRALDRVRDAQGRSISADALLLAILNLRSEGPRVRAAERLRSLLLDETPPAMLPGQRIFLMKRMAESSLPAALRVFPALGAEELAEAVLEATPRLKAEPVLRACAVPEVWQLGTPDGRALVLLRTSTLQAGFQNLMAGQHLPPGVQLLLSSTPCGDPALLQRLPAGPLLPGWELALVRRGPDPLAGLASRQAALYGWIGALVAGAGGILTLLAARAVSRSLGLARLKADLTAAVTHELKTPIASIQVLVDNLLDEEQLDPWTTREYLELISQANTRLGRVVANFLAYGRLERHRYPLDRAPLRIAELLPKVLEAAGPHLRGEDCRLEVDLEPGLPMILADEEALVTVLVNLLDNAWKFSPGEKRILLRVCRQGSELCLAVTDHGIGIPQRDLKRVFRSFHQVDSRLARAQGGCGLGLAIVAALVKAHGGHVAVTSEPGAGSTFTVYLRIAP